MGRACLTLGTWRTHGGMAGHSATGEGGGQAGRVRVWCRKEFQHTPRRDGAHTRGIMEYIAPYDVKPIEGDISVWAM